MRKVKDRDTHAHYDGDVSIIDLAGGGSKFATVDEMKKWLDKLRDEDA